MTTIKVNRAELILKLQGKRDEWRAELDHYKSARQVDVEAMKEWESGVISHVLDNLDHKNIKITYNGGWRRNFHIDIHVNLYEELELLVVDEPPTLETSKQGFDMPSFRESELEELEQFIELLHMSDMKHVQLTGALRNVTKYF